MSSRADTRDADKAGARVEEREAGAGGGTATVRVGGAGESRDGGDAEARSAPAEGPWVDVGGVATVNAGLREAESDADVDAVSSSSATRDKAGSFTHSSLVHSLDRHTS